MLVSGYAQATDYTVVFNSSNSYEKRHDKISSGSFTDKFKINLTAPKNVTIAFDDDWKVLTNLSIFVDSSTDYGPFTFSGSGEPTIGTFALGAGSSEIRFSGTSGKDGRYTILLTQSAIAPPAPQPPVPEPAEWTLLLAGFMVIGFIARRRKRLLG